jgi:WD and tetratricopeptide repeat-containing protein 1
MDEAEKLRWPFSDGSVTDLLDARSLHGSPVRPLRAANP